VASKQLGHQRDLLEGQRADGAIRGRSDPIGLA